jgi:hypothetical protein
VILTEKLSGVTSRRLSSGEGQGSRKVCPLPFVLADMSSLPAALVQVLDDLLSVLHGPLSRLHLQRTIMHQSSPHSARNITAHHQLTQEQTFKVQLPQNQILLRQSYIPSQAPSQAMPVVTHLLGECRAGVADPDELVGLGRQVHVPGLHKGRALRADHLAALAAVVPPANTATDTTCSFKSVPLS